MEQLNMQLPESQEVNRPAAVAAYEVKPESPLLRKVRGNFVIFGGISLIFGILFALLFYKTRAGLNFLLFTSAIIVLMIVIMRKLSVPVKSETKFYYAGAFLLGLSTVFTASPVLQFFNFVGILLLLDLSLLHQFYDDRKWDFVKHFFRVIGLFFQSIAAVGRPFIDCINFMKRTKVFKNDKVRNIFLGVVISIPFLFIILALLANADLLFDRLTSKVFHFVFSTDIFAIIFMVVFGFLACYCIICASVTKPKLEEERAFKKADASIAATFMIVLCLVYAIFCAIQIIYLFANGLFILPDQYTFAEYARRGFFELLTVAIINVALMVLSKNFFHDNKVLRLAVTFMTLCTYIMIGSATYRMLLYIGAYHLTFLRVFVLFSLLLIALILAGVIIAEYKQSFPLFRYCVAVVSVCYIAFSFSKPDYFIASYLIEHTEVLDAEDVSYLTDQLSLDAAPAVLPVLADEKYYAKIDKAKPNWDFRDFNYSESLAADYAKKYPISK